MMRPPSCMAFGLREPEPRGSWAMRCRWQAAYSSMTMAPMGHSSMHSPHSMQESSFTTAAVLPTMSSTPSGQASTQIPQPEHSSVSISGAAIALDSFLFHGLSLMPD